MTAEKKIELLRIHRPYTCAPPVINQAPYPVKVINLFPPDTPSFTPRTRSKKSRQDITGENPLRKIITLGATIVLPSPSSHRRRPRSTRKLSLFVIPVAVKDKRYLRANLPHSTGGLIRAERESPEGTHGRHVVWDPSRRPTANSCVIKPFLPHYWVEEENTAE